MLNKIQEEIGDTQKDSLDEITEVEDLICGFKAIFNNKMGSYRRKNLLASFNKDYTAFLTIIVASR
ncbi:MAG: hypothetical protein GPJ54_14245 [Candidatus Heimdallarchaeota archaeon]|nr:hypothetical protein [Candidatus Heimdallarchaeota archaeon]